MLTTSGKPISAPIDAHSRKWDPVVKLTHWSAVAAVVINALITEEGAGTHVWVGYALAAILALRLLWGLVGPREARFASFRPSPARALGHIRDIATGRHSDHPSHNPLGALMVYAIWATLGAIIASGIAMTGVPDRSDLHASPAPIVEASLRESGDEESSEEERGEADEGLAGEIHEAAVNLLYALIVLHLAGVAFETRRSGSHILMAMLPGRR